MPTRKLVVGITGASGAIYAQRFLIQATKHFDEIYLTMSDQAIQVADTELGYAPCKERFDTREWLGAAYPQIKLLDSKNYFTPPASGSFRHDGMVIVPCSMGTAGRIANRYVYISVGNTAMCGRLRYSSLKSRPYPTTNSSGISKPT